MDLGTIDGPALVFGGPYSNLQATKAMRAEAARLGIPPERTLCTGDVVAYGGDPAATVAEIRDWGVAVVQGNCEAALGDDAEDCGCGFAEGSTCDALSKAWYPFARDALDAEAKAWMAALPRTVTLQIGRLRLAAIHGGATDIARFVFDSQADGVFVEELDALGPAVDGALAGHCGLPFARKVGWRSWINAGAIGMPANDGTTDVWYALIHPRDGDRVEVSHHRLAYAHHSAARAMRAAGLPEGYAMALETGFWPSLDVLPAPERAATGKPLTPGVARL